jgi:ribonuclease HI
VIKELLEYFQIEDHLWDAIVIGDGSATTWEREAGWGSLLIRRDDVHVKAFHGGMSCGTNNLSEILAILHPLMFLVNAAEVRNGGYRVHVISDSQYVINGLADDKLLVSPTLKTNRELWLAMFGVVRQGLVITAHHIDRDQLDYQRVCHDLANLSRKSQIGLTEQLKWNIQDITRKT